MEPLVRTTRYLERFRCIGAACEDNCCAGWQAIDVDAESFARYAQVDDPTLASALRQHVRPNPTPAGPEEAALIVVPAGGQCPFFGPDRLCAIQASLGEAGLPTGCDTFPRQAALVEGQIELAASLSCPEVARLALLAADALEPVEVEPGRRLGERGRYWVELPWSDELPAGDPRRHYHHLRALVVGLLRHHEAALEARLRALGQALGRLDAWPGFERPEIERVFDEAAASLPALRAEIEATPARADGPPALLLERVQPWIGMDGVPPRYRACLDRLRDGLQLSSDPRLLPGPRLVTAYAAGRRALQLYEQARPYVLENALLNQVQLSNFPFHPSRSLFDEYAVFACRHALIKLHLIGAGAVAGSLSDELVVETVQAFDKYADSPDYWERTLRLLRRGSALDQAGLATLLLD